MKLKKELKLFFLLCLGFADCYYFKAENTLFQREFFDSFILVKEYDKEHVLKCIVKDFLIDGVTGLLFNLGDTEQLANYIFQTLNNYNEATKMGLRGKQFAEKNFNLTKITDRLEGIYKDVVSG